MRLHTLVEGLDVAWSPRASADPEVSGLTHDSRRAAAGSLFLAWRGDRFDGLAYAKDAVGRGAVAVIGDGEEPPDLGVPFLRAEEPRRLLGTLAGRLWGHPDRELKMVGVTGTNGKGTVVSIVAAILEATGHPCGVFGTHGNRFTDLDLTAGSGRTTPEASDLFAGLRAIREQGGEAAALEVSSHALVLHRVDALRFDVVALTNLTRDHLDFHGDEASYRAAKRRLFGLRKEKARAVLFVDDPFGRELADELGAEALRVGRDGDVRATSVEMTADGLGARVRTPRFELTLSSPLLGAFNLANVLVAVGIAEALGLPRRSMEDGVAAAGVLPGRMERVDPGGDLPVVVDYAHTPAALEAALRGMREIGTEHLIAVFGCGGDRDPGKRRPMGEIAGRLAELPIATSDNPRSEDPLAILAEIEEGLKASGNHEYRVVPDRGEAIRRAVAVAGPGSAVLIAGKGHEEEQITADEIRPFSDREEALAALEARRGSLAHG